MTETTRRERSRDDTQQEIRRVARELLINQGREAVTLRAIAREMGITAPAIYRYHASLEDLLQQLCLDICTDLADDMATDLAAIPSDDTPAQVFAVCRGFRAWALRHPQEFSLVFASPPGSGAPAHDLNDPFGRIFLTVAGRVLATRQVAMPAEDKVPAELRADLAEFRATLFTTLAEAGLDLPEHVFSIGAAYTMLRFWVRLYGQVALEVFGRFPFAVSAPEPLFESMLAELAKEVGLTS